MAEKIILMQIGKLRHYVELQSSDDVKNDFNEIEKIWTTFDSVWASIEPLRGRESLENQQVNAELTHRIVIRYHSAVNAKCRVKFGTRIFDISVPPRNIEEKNVYQELLCKEAV